MSQKNYVSLSKLSTFLDKLAGKFAALTHDHKLSEITDYSIDSALSPTSTNPVQNSVIDAEFEAVSQAMLAMDLAIDDLPTEEMIPNLYVWKKYDSNPDDIKETSRSNVCIDWRLTYVSYSFSVDYSDAISTDGGSISLVNKQVVSINTADQANVLLGKYVHSSGNILTGAMDNDEGYFFIPEDATFTISSDNLYVSKATKLSIPQYLSYVASKSFNTYTTGSQHTDGYWYKYIKKIGDSAVVDSSSVNFTETDPTVPAWAKAASKPSYTKSEVGLGNVDNTSDANKPVSTAQATAIAEAKDVGIAAQTNLNTHINDKNNPHGMTLAHLGVTATAAELNYVDGATSNIQTQLNKKADDFSIEIYNGTGGNPKPVRFASFNYSTCNSENGISAKISLVSGHGNGSSYAFLEDAIIRVRFDGVVEVNNFKYYGASTGTYDGADRQYGDIFWLVDTTNKIVDFYCLMGQYARVYQTPWRRLTYSSGGTVTQHTSCTVYSSGEKTWANNSDIALKSDVESVIEAASNQLFVTIDVENNTSSHGATEIHEAILAGKIVIITIDGVQTTITYHSESEITCSLVLIQGKSVITGTYTIDVDKNATLTDSDMGTLVPMAINDNGKVLMVGTNGIDWYNISENATIADLESRLSALEANVATVHSGTEDPSSALGEDGDIYLYTGVY